MQIQLAYFLGGVRCGGWGFVYWTKSWELGQDSRACQTPEMQTLNGEMSVEARPYP